MRNAKAAKMRPTHLRPHDPAGLAQNSVGRGLGEMFEWDGALGA